MTKRTPAHIRTHWLKQWTIQAECSKIGKKKNNKTKPEQKQQQQKQQQQ